MAFRFKNYGLKIIVPFQSKNSHWGAYEREDWESDWDDDCLRDFLHEKIGNSSNQDWDMILDEFVNLPNN